MIREESEKFKVALHQKKKKRRRRNAQCVEVHMCTNMHICVQVQRLIIGLKFVFLVLFIFDNSDVFLYPLHETFFRNHFFIFYL